MGEKIVRANSFGYTQLCFIEYFSTVWSLFRLYSEKPWSCKNVVLYWAYATCITKQKTRTILFVVVWLFYFAWIGGPVHLRKNQGVKVWIDIFKTLLTAIHVYHLDIYVWLRTTTVLYKCNSKIKLTNGVSMEYFYMIRTVFSERIVKV